MARAPGDRAQNPSEPALTVTNLGTLGVNVVDSPLHLQDGELRQAQNAEPYDVRGESAIRKRLALGLFTPDGLGAPVLAMTSVPLPDPFPPFDDGLDVEGTQAYWSALAGDTDLYASADGITWAPASAPPDEAFASHYLTPYYPAGGAISTTGALIYAQADGATVTLYSWNGLSRTTLATMASAASVVSLAQITHGGTVYVLLSNNAVITPSGGGFTTAVTLGAAASCVCGARNRLYFGMQGAIVYWSNTEGLVTDFTFGSPGGVVHELAVFQGALVAATLSSSPTNRILTRTADGAWSDITPAPGSGDYGPMAILGGQLFVGRSAAGAFSGTEVLAYDGATWTTDLDLTTLLSLPAATCALKTFNGGLLVSASYLFTAGAILRRTAGGVWTIVQTGRVGSNSGGLGFY